MNKAIRRWCWAVLGSFFTASAFGHAALQDAQPSPDAMLDSPPGVLRLGFSEGIEHSFSSVKLQDATGRPVRGALAQSDADETHLVLTLPALASGRYTVQWSVLAKDGHRSRGSYRFTVR